jgi:chemotaxis protein methyltransferase CheR
MASTGLEFRPSREAELAALISRRLSHLGLRDCSAYAAFLAHSSGGPEEMGVLIERLTVGETCFFRNPEQFAAIRDVILPDILDRNKSGSLSPRSCSQ